MADFTSAMREALLDACALDWSAISPALFGSLFQSIMNVQLRRTLGAHFTSEENILKVIKPLFLDALWAEFERVKGQKNRLFELHKKLRTLTFFDPACGCGNFLVISYRELRLLELAVLRASQKLSGHAGQQSVDVHSLMGVNVDQFYGIEIEEFPAQIAQVALWLMDHQMNLQVSVEFGLYFARIPLRTSPHIAFNNALRLDWNEVLPAARCSFLLGNPPFVGYNYQSAQQKADLAPIFSTIKGAGVLDYVAAWYIKAAHYIRGFELFQAEQSPHWVRESAPSYLKPIRVAFVSTNSITQGEQVGVLWSWMLAHGIHIHFAHRTFNWTNEASGKAAVHCVIIGFGLEELPGKVLFEHDDIKGEPHAVPVVNINPYLVDAPNVFLEKRRRPVGTAPEMTKGSQPTDGGNLLLSDTEKQDLLQKEPQAIKWIHPFVGADEFINAIPRWCLWLKDISPSELHAMPLVLQRVQAVKRMRLASTKAATVDQANTPTLFGEDRQTDHPYLLIPRVSSESRCYIPIGHMDADVICSDANFMLPNASLFHFGILTSAMHNAWMRYTCGRLKSDFRYSNTIVYNNFPWPEFPESHKPNKPLAPVHQSQTAIETAAQAVLDVRAKFQAGDPPATLADLYDPLTMPPELLRSHQKLDAAVDKAYEASGGKKSYKSDAKRVAILFERYQKLTSLLPAEKSTSKRKTRRV
ncbi:hypothetical protein GALL_432340 [mine drainage metagenome]|uniref:site-specific DNA-methyltransferase (adenine-specific) n=1 Tax=mine drainage metagenome TaxID=410659 RepID=A0A1J5QGK3_9ZZZZ